MTILNLISEKLLESVHDVSAGGILVALTEMCIQNNIGVSVYLPKNSITIHEYLFGEDQSRYIIEVKEKNIEKVNKLLKNNNIYFERIGLTQKTYMEVKNEFKTSVVDLEKLHKYWFNNYFDENI